MKKSLCVVSSHAASAVKKKKKINLIDASVLRFHEEVQGANKMGFDSCLYFWEHYGGKHRDKDVQNDVNVSRLLSYAIKNPVY